jgi:predicted transglutaminase-like cysteine proteinase
MDRRLCLGALLIGLGSVASPSQALNPPASNGLSVGGPDMLGTRAVAIHEGPFAGSLSQARQDASASPLLQRLVAPARLLSPLQQMAFVQAAVTSRIHWMSDATEWGRHDYWASAAQTLAQGAGDAKNRAIVKLHALRALGFRNTDLFLTIARDRVGGPMTVLTVRNDGRYFVMDDLGGPPFAIEERRNEFRPLMSFGMYGAWVHSPTLAPQRGTSTTLMAASASTGATIQK